MPLSVVPTAATSAIFDPEMPEKMYMATMTACSRPPCSRPTTAVTQSARGLVSPPSVMILPARMKNGTASRMKLLIPLVSANDTAIGSASPEPKM